VKNLLFILLLVIVFIDGCAPNRSTPLNIAYHDLTAHYNAHFIANEHIKAIEADLYDTYQWNYNRILPIYAPFDSVKSAGWKEKLQDCIEKGSLAIQRHPGSKWEYPTYILVGKARYYGLEIQDAIETFKYVNTKSKNPDDRHEALIHLMRVFAMNKEFNNAVAVIDYLKKEEMNAKNQHLYYLNQAFVYQERGDLDKLVENLAKAEELQTYSRDKARIQFILGQVYQQLGFDASAYYYYEKSLRNSPTYELEFFTKLNMAQVTQKSEGRDMKTVRKYFKRLLRDRKNVEYNDKIYYEMGLFELKNGNLDLAIANFKTSVRMSQKNERQKGLSYLSLARIHYDSLKQFELAKSYYDSTVNTLPKDEENYAAIKVRQEILTEFVKHLLIIRTNDSLLNIAKLPPNEIEAWATRLASKDSIQSAEEKIKKEKLVKAAEQKQVTFDKNQGTLISTSGDVGWYFANPTSVSRGTTAFQRKWKNRPLEDNWRRSVKIVTNFTPQEERPVAQTKDAPTEMPGKEVSTNEKIQTLIAAVPTTEEQKAKLRLEILEAMYALGNLYNFKLQEKGNAIETFDDLLARFPKSHYEPEVLYQLYLLHGETNPDLRRLAANRLLTEHPESVYAKLVENPNYREETFAATMQMQAVYKKAYAWYKSGNYAPSLALLDSVMRIHPKNEFSDNVQLLRIMNIGYLEGQYKYQFELDNFVKTYSESELIPYVRDLIRSTDEYQANIYSSSKAKYVPFFEQTHYLILIYPPSDANGKLAADLFDGFIKKTNASLKFGNLLLTEEHSVALINNIDTKAAAFETFQAFQTYLNEAGTFKGILHSIFVLTEDNFDLMYKTKDIDSYKAFFEKNYP